MAGFGPELVIALSSHLLVLHHREGVQLGSLAHDTRGTSERSALATTPRVGGHVLLCTLAYHVEHHMRARLAPMLYDETDHEAAAAKRASGIFSTTARNRSRTRRAASYWWTTRGSTRRSEARVRRWSELTRRAACYTSNSSRSTRSHSKRMASSRSIPAIKWQSLILPVLGKALGLPQERIVMRTYSLGGGFGRRLNGDYAVPAALAAKALGKPVKMVLTRPDDMRFDSFRSPSIQTLRMAFHADGKVAAMEHHASAGWPTAVVAQGFMAKGLHGMPYDPFAIAGADHWYNVSAQRVRALSNDVANRSFRPGWLRSVGPGWTNWALETFMDEAALAAQNDPVAFRLGLLDGTGRNAGSAPNAVGGAKRQAAVVQRVAQKAGWGAAMPKDTGLGIATTFGQERDMPTWIACVARVRVNRGSGAVNVEKLTIVVDAGTVVDPDSALAQTEGGALWRLSMALHEGTEFVEGQVKDTNLDTYTPLRIGDVPELDIEFVDSTEVPVGLGEPPTTVVGPAIGNAIFAAVGARLRHLPIRPAAVLEALAHPR
jgi:isoquinoline 1-oxidoreductase subunit beta